MTPCCLVHVIFHINLHIHRRQCLKCYFINLYILIAIFIYFKLFLIIQVQNFCTNLTINKYFLKKMAYKKPKFLNLRLLLLTLMQR